MALADIINRIASDGSAESESVLSAASARAEQLLSQARDEAAAEHQRAIEAANRQASLRAATILAAARLEARDRALAARRQLVDSAMAALVTDLESMPADRYVAFLAAGIAETARSGDSVSVAPADAEHIPALKAAVAAAAPGVSLQWSSDPAAIVHGVVVSGSRTHLEISPSAVVHERRASLELVLASELFVGEER